MGHGTDKTLEHAEHTQHAAHNPFDRRVAMSMAIVAAALAGATLLSHRGHTETLRLTSMANIYHTRMSDQYGFYQAKNLRSTLYQSNLENTKIFSLNKECDPDTRDKILGIWLTQVNKYEGKAAKGSEKEQKDFWSLMEDYLQSKDKKAKKPNRFDDPKQSELTDLQLKADAMKKRAEKYEHLSHELHGHVNWIDYGHLALELGLVLASIAVLTKGRGFWFTGLGVSGLGVVLVVIGLVGTLRMEHIEESHAADHGAEHKKDGGHKKESGGKTEGDHKPTSSH